MTKSKNSEPATAQNFFMRGLMLGVMFGVIVLPLTMCAGIFFVQEDADRATTYGLETEVYPAGIPEEEVSVSEDVLSDPIEESAVPPPESPVLNIATTGDVSGEGFSDEELREYAPESDSTAFDLDSADTEFNGGETLPETSSVLMAAPMQPASPLKAGEIDDNAKWDDYMSYYRETLDTLCPQVNGSRSSCNNTIRQIYVSGRNIITVVDEAGLPVAGATVEIFADGGSLISTRTFADGRTLYFPEMFAFDEPPDQFTAVATKGDSSTEIVLEPGRVLYEIVLPDVDINRDAVRLDVMFLIDATGSMADEIAQLQDNILAISSQIDALPGDVDARYGLVAYRDRGDDYVTQVYEFTPDVTAFQVDLNSVVADGGGDTPEALNEGLDDALKRVEWRGEDAIKLVFLVADAPPHLDYRDDVKYDRSILDALERGIKIHTIASSGLDMQGEYIFRQISQVTMGHFIFLTYEDGTPGEPGEERKDLHVGDPEDEQGNGDYSVEQLDELVLRLITDELAAYRGETPEDE